MDKLRVQLLDDKNYKIVDGVILKEEQSVIYIEIEEPDFPATLIGVGKEVHMKIFGDKDGLKIYKGTISYRLGGLVTLSDLSLMVSIQRRNDLKIHINYELVITCISRVPEIVVKAKFLDISAGGACFSLDGTKRRFVEGEVFETIFDLGRCPFFIKMKVLRAIEEPSGRILYGCQFVDISKEEEQIIREFVFKTQLVSRRRLPSKLV